MMYTYKMKNVPPASLKMDMNLIDFFQYLKEYALYRINIHSGFMTIFNHDQTLSATINLNNFQKQWT